MTWSKHLKAALRSEPAKVSKSQMVLCGLATGLPLLIGLLNNQVSISIYGALTGYFLTVHDHSGTLTDRLKLSAMTFAMLVTGFTLGLYFQQRHLGFFVVLGILTYWVGLTSEKGTKLETAFLFSTIQMIVAAHSPYIGKEAALATFGYALIGFSTVATSTALYILFFKRDSTVMASPQEAPPALPQHSKLERQLHAASYVVAALISAFLVEYYAIERGYWTIVTVLLIMKPDRTRSVYRSFQRLVGTCLGVFFSVGVIYAIHSQVAVVPIIALAASLVPWAIKRNFWMVSFLIAIIVILLLELPTILHGDYHTPILRLRATALGSALSIAGVIISKLLSLLAKRIRGAPLEKVDMEPPARI